MKISTCINEKSRYSKNWSINNIENEKELIEVVRSAAYSNAYFKNNKRSQDNIIGYHQFLILDIDNDDAHFTIEDCKRVFKEKAIKSLIVPSKSHLKNKNGVIKERYRIFCYLDQVIPADISKEQYKEMMKLIVEDLNMTEHVDNKALFDRARLYYPTHNLEEYFIERTDGADIELQKYIDQSAQAIADKDKNKTVKKIKKGEVSTTTSPAYIPSTIRYTINKDIYDYDITAIGKEIDFEELIHDLEGVCSSENNNKGTKIKTALSNTYQLFTETMVLHDFKNEVSYNLISYIMHKKESKKIEVLDTLKNYVDIEDYRTISHHWQNAIRAALSTAKNLNELKKQLISSLNFQAINIHRDKEDILYIAGKKYHISDFMLPTYKNKQDIIKQFQKNREKV